MSDTDLLARVLTQARTQNAWLDKPVPDALLREIWDTAKWGPTSVNSNPARIVFVRTPAEKDKLIAALNPGNVAKTRAAPVTAILGYDLEFWRKLDKLFAHKPEMARNYASNPVAAESTAFRNGSLQGAYFMIAARAHGIDVGAMSGFDHAKIDAAFFAGTSVRSNFLCNLGYGDPAGLFPRQPRLDFEEACRLA
jgi:3-hydroxypropanoate dehydrogenase